MDRVTHQTQQVEHNDDDRSKDDGIPATLVQSHDLAVCMAGTAHLSIHHRHLQHDEDEGLGLQVVKLPMRLVILKKRIRLMMLRKIVILILTITTNSG